MNFGGRTLIMIIDLNKQLMVCEVEGETIRRNAVSSQRNLHSSRSYMDTANQIV